MNFELIVSRAAEDDEKLFEMSVDAWSALSTTHSLNPIFISSKGKTPMADSAAVTETPVEAPVAVVSSVEAPPGS